MRIRKFNEIPGLFLVSDCFTASQCNTMIQEALDLYQRLEKASVSQNVQQAHIPQPEFVQSERHNLSSEELYMSIKLDEDNKELRCEYFPRYGEDGHALAYFRGNDNLPDFIHKELLGQLHKLMCDLALVELEKKMHWKLTLNYYKSTGNTVAGFPFHVDIPANGVVTMIVNIQREAQFQIAKDEILREVIIPVGGLLVLSGESRYVWKHRVLPMGSSQLSTQDDIERISLVLGFK